MDDLISRKALIAEYDRVHVGPPGGARKLIEEAPEVPPKVVAEIKIDGDTLRKLVDEAIEEIKAMQSDPDVVRVVRCKDCRFRDKPHMSSAWLPCVDMKVPDDFYCARGEWE